MSAPAAAPPRTCPHCAAPLADGQDWCLECGHAVTTRLTRQRTRRTPIALALVALAVAGAVAALALTGRLGGSGGPRPSRSAAPAGGTQATSAATPAPASTTPAPQPVSAPAAPRWPHAEEAYTVVLMATPNRVAAERRARGLVAHGADAGILRSDRYRSFPPGQWIVWRGRYQSRTKAEQALGLIQRSGTAAYVIYVQLR